MYSRFFWFYKKGSQRCFGFFKNKSFFSTYCFVEEGGIFNETRNTYFATFWVSKSQFSGDFDPFIVPLILLTYISNIRQHTCHMHTLDFLVKLCIAKTKVVSLSNNLIFLKTHRLKAQMKIEYLAAQSFL